MKRKTIAAIFLIENSIKRQKTLLTTKNTSIIVRA